MEGWRDGGTVVAWVIRVGSTTLRRCCSGDDVDDDDDDDDDDDNDDYDDVENNYNEHDKEDDANATRSDVKRIPRLKSTKHWQHTLSARPCRKSIGWRELQQVEQKIWRMNGWVMDGCVCE